MANAVKEHDIGRQKLEGIVKETGIARLAKNAKESYASVGLQCQTTIFAVAYTYQAYAAFVPQITSLCAAVIGSYLPH